MRIGIFSDVHANLPALETVLAKLRDEAVDLMYCLGDTVGYGPYPNECIELVRTNCKLVLKGNHDSGLIGETSVEDFNPYGLKALLWSQERVTDEYKAYLGSLPYTAIEHEVTFAHSSPMRPAEWSYVLTLRAAKENFHAFTTKICYIGHTHVPVVINEDMTVGEYRKNGPTLVSIRSILHSVPLSRAYMETSPALGLEHWRSGSG